LPDVIFSDLSQARLGGRRRLRFGTSKRLVLRKSSQIFWRTLHFSRHSLGINPTEDNFLGVLADRAGRYGTMRREYKNGGPAMAHPVQLRVIAGVPKDCNFWLEHDSWNGICEELAVTVRGSSFEDAKRKMEAALQAHIESVLCKQSRASRKKVA
jgi:hypothetical protein